MLNPTIILAFLGAKVISLAICSIVYALDGNTPLFFSSLLSSIGCYIMIHYFVQTEKN